MPGPWKHFAMSTSTVPVQRGQTILLATTTIYSGMFLKAVQGWNAGFVESVYFHIVLAA